jgi:hypothetical protein
LASATTVVEAAEAEAVAQDAELALVASPDGRFPSVAVRQYLVPPDT